VDLEQVLETGRRCGGTERRRDVSWRSLLPLEHLRPWPATREMACPAPPEEPAAATLIATARCDSCQARVPSGEGHRWVWGFLNRMGFFRSAESGFCVLGKKEQRS
jgi:hypothetical protein